MEQKVETIEVVNFRLKEEISNEKGKEILLQLNEIVSQFDGFIERKLSVNENGEWIDIVYWSSMEAALSASEQAANNSKVLEALGIVDESSMTMKHFQLLNQHSN